MSPRRRFAIILGVASAAAIAIGAVSLSVMRNDSCTLAGCTSSISLFVGSDEWRTVKTITLCADSNCTTGHGPGSVLIEVTPRPGAGSRDVVVVADRRGTRSPLVTTRTVDVARRTPNGEGCAATCWIAKPLRYADGRLTPKNPGTSFPNDRVFPQK